MSLFIYFSICENYCTLSEPPVSLCFHMINMAEDGEVLTNDTLPPGLFREEGSVPGYLERLEDLERYAIQRALKKYGNHYEGKQKAAHTLGIGVATLYRKMKKYGLDT